MAEDIAGGAAPARPHLAEDLTFDQLGALIQKAHLFLGIDSAPMHLAAAVNQRVVALFGPSSHLKWRPWCEHYRVVAHPCSCQENMNLVCPKTEVMKCLQAITVEEVLSAAQTLLAESAPRPGLG